MATYGNWAVFGSLILLGAMLLQIVEEQAQLTERIFLEHSQGLLAARDAKAREFEAVFSRARARAELLATLPALQQLGAESEAEGMVGVGRAQRNIAIVFTAALEQTPGVEQLRVIALDDLGKEIVRVERGADGRARTTPQSELQEKGERDYMRAARQVVPGDTYLSSIGVNMEFGQPEMPERLVFRAVSVPRANPNVAIVINFNANKTLEQSLSSSRLEAGQVLLLSDADDRMIFRSDEAGGFGSGRGWDEAPPLSEVFTFDEKLQRRWLGDEPRDDERRDFKLLSASGVGYLASPAVAVEMGSERVPVQLNVRILEPVRQLESARAAALIPTMLQLTGPWVAILTAGMLMYVFVLQRKRLNEQAFLDRVDRASEAGLLGLWERDLDSGRVTWSRQLWLLRGLIPESRPLDFEETLLTVHPEDVDLVREARSADTFQVTFRVVHPDGTERVIEQRGRIEVDQHGIPARAVGTEIDVTERVSAEVGLAQFKYALDDTADAVFMIDSRTLQFVYVNRGAENQLGYTRRELQQMHPYDIKPEVSEAQFRALLAPLLNGERPNVRLETVHRHQNGGEIPVEVYLQLLPGGGSQQLVLNIVEDISQRRQAEEARALEAAAAVNQAEGRYRLLAENTSDLVLLFAPNGKLLYESLSSKRMFAGFFEPDTEFSERLRRMNAPGVQTFFDEIAEHGGEFRETLFFDLPQGGVWIDYVMRGVRDPAGEHFSVLWLGREVTELINERNRYALLAENTSDFVALYSSEGEVRYESPSIRKAFENDPLRTGRSLAERLFVLDRSAAKTVREGFESVLETGGEVRTVVRYPFGHDHCWLDVVMTAVPDYFPEKKAVLITARDVTAQLEEQRRYQILADNSSDLVTLAAADGTVIYDSPAAEAALPGLTQMHNFLTRAQTQDQAEWVISEFKRLAAEGGSARRTITVKQKGRWFFFDMSMQGARTDDGDDKRFAVVIASRDITALVEEQRRYRLVADNLTDLIAVFDQRGRFVYQSPRTEKFLPIADFPGLEAFLKRLPTFHAEKIQAGFDSILSGGEIFRYQLQIEVGSKNGWFDIQFSGLPDELGGEFRVLSVARDVTALVAEERRYQLLADNTTDMVSLYSLEGDAVYDSPSTQKLMSRSRTPAPGTFSARMSWALEKSLAAEAVRRFERVVQTGVSEEHEYAIGRRWFWVSMRRVDDAGGKPAYVVGVARDVTVTREARAELAEARNRLSSSARFVTAGELAASISHEVNQPIGAIVANTGAAVRWLDHTPSAVEEVRRALEAIRADALRASEVLTRVRGVFSKQEMTLEPVDVGSAIGRLVSMRGLALRPSYLRIKLALPESPLLAWADLTSLQQIMVNLARNARDAMLGLPENRRVLSISVASSSAEEVMIRVRDSGPGVPEGVKRHLFEPFVSDKTQGIGIGLWISRSLAEKQGGKLVLEESSADGAGFLLTLKAVVGDG